MTVKLGVASQAHNVCRWHGTYCKIVQRTQIIYKNVWTSGKKTRFHY